MQSTCPYAGCGAVFNLGPQHVGRKFQCNRCGTLLLVQADGLHLATKDATGAAPQPEPAYDPPAAPEQNAPMESMPAPARRSAKAAKLLQNLPADFFTYLFLAGSVLVILFAFLPLLDKFSIDKAQSVVAKGEHDQARKDRAMTIDNKTPSPDDMRRRQDERKDWEKKKLDLESDVEDVKISADASRYWYGLGMMLGFLVLSVAAIGYLADALTVKRIVGSIVICSLLLLVFIVSIVAAAAH